MRSAFEASKADRYLKFALVIGTLLSALLVGSLIWLLLSYNHISWGADIDKSLIGVLGDFIGGIVGTIFTIIATFLIWLTYNSQKVELAETRKLVRQQLEATHLPHFTIKKHVQPYTELSQMISADHTYGDFGYFNLGLLNIGNEPAKEVLLEWDYFDSFDRRREVIAVLNKVSSKDKDQHLSNLDYLESYRNNDAKYYAETDRSYDYILPVTVNEDVSQNLNISIPFKLAVIYYELNHYLLKNLGKKQHLSPLGYVSLNYKNSLNNSLSQSFELHCLFSEEIVQGELRQWLEVRAIEVTKRNKIA